MFNYKLFKNLLNFYKASKTFFFWLVLEKTSLTERNLHFQVMFRAWRSGGKVVPSAPFTTNHVSCSGLFRRLHLVEDVHQVPLLQYASMLKV